jgi:MoaA/NifB/PqqE/SkfB family radical SAM enzyme
MSKKDWGGIILKPGCVNYCVFCGKVPRASKEELQQQEEKVAKNLDDFKKKGIKQIEISGNDPIEYDHIASLIRHIKRTSFEVVQLSTHGRRLADEFFLDSLIVSGIDRLRIPLYGSQAKVHDSVTRSQGSFDETYQGIRLLRKKAPYVHVQISCLIMQQNKDDLINIVKLAQKLKIKDIYFAVPFLARKDDYSYYLPMRDLAPYVRQIYNYTAQVNYPVRFTEIPYCVFGVVSELINNNSLPPDLGKYCQPDKEYRTNIKDLPAYRLKKKVNMCYKCKCINFCDGFPVNDIDKFGPGNLKPIIK